MSTAIFFFNEDLEQIKDFNLNEIDECIISTYCCTNGVTEESGLIFVFYANPK